MRNKNKKMSNDTIIGFHPLQGVKVIGGRRCSQRQVFPLQQSDGIVVEEISGAG